MVDIVIRGQSYYAYILLTRELHTRDINYLDLCSSRPDLSFRVYFVFTGKNV